MFVILNPSGAFSSTDGRFTKTVSRNDEDVLISMTANNGLHSGSTIEWRKSGIIVSSNGNSSVYAFENPVSLDDEGIYEIYYTGERETGRIGLYRLIVRGLFHFKKK